MILKVVTLDPAWPLIVKEVNAKYHQQDISCLNMDYSLVIWRNFSFWWHCCGYPTPRVVRFAELQLCLLATRADSLTALSYH